MGPGEERDYQPEFDFGTTAGEPVTAPAALGPEGAGGSDGAGALVVSGELAVLEQAFVDAVRVLKRTDVVAPVIVVVGSHLQHVYLRRRLARSLTAVANVRFLTLTDLAGELTLARTADQPRPLLPEGAQIPLLEQVIERHRTRLGDADMVHAIAALLRDLRQGGIDPRLLTTPAGGGAWKNDLAAIAVAYRAALAPYVDRTRTLEEAAAASAADVAQVLGAGANGGGGPAVLVYGVYQVSALQFTLLRTLSRALPVTLFVPWRADAEPFAFADRMVRRLRATGFRLRQAAAVRGDAAAPQRDAAAPQRDAAPPQRDAAAPQQDAAAPQQDAAALPRPDAAAPGAPAVAARGARLGFSAADRQAEVEEAVRRVLEDLGHGVPAAEIALLHRLDQVFDEMLAGALERAALPCYRAAGRPVRRSVVGRAALNLLHLLYEEPRRGRLLELLSLPGIDLSWLEPDLASRPARWEAQSKALGLVQGWQEFETVLALHLAQEAAAEELSAGATRARESAQELLTVVRGFMAESERVQAAAGWRVRAELFVDLLERVLPGWRASDETAAVSDRMRALGALDDAAPVAVPASVAGFRAAAEAAVRQAVVSGGYFQRDGVFVGNVATARLLRFRRVYLLGCAERTFPPVMRQDPLLPDADRERINAAVDAGFLPLKRDRLNEERLLFELACQAGTEQVTFSYSRRSSGSTTVRLPSSFLLEELGDLAGAFLSAEALERQPRPWFARLPSRIGFHGAAPGDALRALDASDLRYHVLEQGGGAAVAAVDAFWPGRERLRQAWRERRVHRFGPFDGIVPAPLVAAAGVLQRDLTATALADYAVCPYRFFLARVLRVRAGEEPEQTLEIAPVQRGNLVHAILDALVAEFLSGDQSWPEFLGAIDLPLQRIMEQQFARLPAGITGLPLTWSLIREQVVTEIHAYLDAVRAAEAGAEAGTAAWRPVATEQRFTGVEIPAGRHRLRFSGRIDRIDLSHARDRSDQAPTAARVVDYKTGAGSREQAHGYRTGGSLQLPVYLHAVAARQGVPLAACHAEFQYVSERAGYRRIMLAGAELARDARLEQVLEAMADGIAAGAFFPQPGKERQNCRLCDYYDVCRADVAQTGAQKKWSGSEDLTAPFSRIGRPEAGR